MAFREPEIIRAIFYPTGTYNKQYHRSYITKNTGDMEISDLILNATREGRNINEGALSSVIGDILEFDIGNRNVIDIDNGWEEERLGFIIVILESEYNDFQKLNILTGYTDHADISMVTRSFDPEMKLHVNNTITLSEKDIDMGTGPRRKRRLRSNELILRGRRPKRGGGSWGGDNGDVTIRPADIFYRDSSSGIITAMGGADRSIDGRSNFSGDFVSAHRRHNHMTSYLTDIIRTGIATKAVHNNADNDSDDSIENRIMDAAAYSPSEYAAATLDKTTFDSQNVIFRRFMNECSFDRDATITIEELASAVYWPEEVNKLFSISDVRRRVGEARAISRTGDSENWNRSDEVGIIATIVSRSLPAIMLQSLIADCTVVITNETETGEMDITVMNERPIIEGLDTERLADSMEDIIRMDLANIISRNGDYDITVTVDINITQDQIIDIAWNGEDEVRFIAPLFCDGLISPQKSDSEYAIEEITTNLIDVIDDLSGAMTD